MATDKGTGKTQSLEEKPSETPLEQKIEKPAQPVAVEAEEEKVVETSAAKPAVSDNSAPLCSNCGNMTQRSGSCYVCTTCGSTSGCS